MRMIAPRLGETPDYRTIAEQQEQYKPVTVALVRNPLYASNNPHWNTIVAAYMPSAEEIVKLQAGEPIYIHFLTFGERLTPHIVSIGDADAKGMYDLP